MNLSNFTRIPRNRTGRHVTDGVLLHVTEQAGATISIPSEWRNKVSSRQPLFAVVMLSDDQDAIAIRLTTNEKEADARPVYSSGRIACGRLAKELGAQEGRYTFHYRTASEDGTTAIFMTPKALRKGVES